MPSQRWNILLYMSGTTPVNLMFIWRQNSTASDQRWREKFKIATPLTYPLSRIVVPLFSKQCRFFSDSYSIAVQRDKTRHYYVFTVCYCPCAFATTLTDLIKHTLLALICYIRFIFWFEWFAQLPMIHWFKIIILIIINSEVQRNTRFKNNKKHWIFF